MKLPGKLSLFFIFLTFPYVFSSVTDPNNCHWIAWSQEIKEFGSRGLDGPIGQVGSNGKNSDSLTIFADGSPLNLNLAGQSGTDGDTGATGKDSNCKEQPKEPNRNLQGANGGNGGNGGDGGDGGDGGALTIYTSNPANLRQITVNAAGGKGGQPGAGGSGGKGCGCNQIYWTIPTCTGKPGDPNYSCTTREFRCQNGLDGKGGTSGRVGKDGRAGKLTLINLDQPLTSDQPSAAVTMAALKDRGFVLSKNKWETRTGAIALFAPGSVIDDQYLALVERIERSFILIWNAPQPFDKFANKPVTLTLEENGEIKAVLPNDLWLEATTQKRNNVTEMVVYNAVYDREVVQLKSAGLSGNGNKLRLELVDQASQSNLIGSKFRIKYRVSQSDEASYRATDYMTKYEGEVPPELVTFEGNRFILDLGKLPIDPDYLRSGTGVEIEVIATRTFAGYSKEQKVTERAVIRGIRQ